MSQPAFRSLATARHKLDVRGLDFVFLKDLKTNYINILIIVPPRMQFDFHRPGVGDPLLTY